MNAADKVPLPDLLSFLADEAESAATSVHVWERQGYRVDTMRERARNLRAAHTILTLVQRHEPEFRSIISQRRSS